MTIEQEFDLLLLEHNSLDIRSGESSLILEQEPEFNKDMYEGEEW